MLLSISFLLVFPVSGKVFRLFGGAGEDAFQDGTLPWDTAYRTEMSVNGRPAVVTVYSARYSEPVVNQLKKRFEQLGATVQLVQSGDGATGRAAWPDRTAGFMVVKPPQEPVQQIFIYEPTGKQERAAEMPVPDFNRAKVRNTITDDDTGTYLATLQTSASCTEVHSFYASALQAEGWEMVAPALVKNGRISGMAVYQKKQKICYVQAVDRVGGLNLITLLVKGGAL
ncbi:hypothetical protein P4C99_19190 [Pontiellaceae bacterium B1224]|nr:hypothetical protein [Pontiellaceae bacterium B1224]